MLEDCSEACTTCTVGSCDYTSKLSIVAQRNHCDYYFTMLYHFLAIRNKPLSSPNSLQGQNWKKQYNTCHKPSQRASQWSHGRCNLVQIMSNSIICLNLHLNHLWSWSQSDAHQFYADSCDCYWCASNAHPVCSWSPYENGTTIPSNTILESMLCCLVMVWFGYLVADWEHFKLKQRPNCPPQANFELDSHVCATSQACSKTSETQKMRLSKASCHLPVHCSLAANRWSGVAA